MIKKFESMKDKHLIITAINADIQVKTIYNLLRAGQSIASVYYIYIYILHVFVYTQFWHQYLTDNTFIMFIRYTLDLTF